MSQAINLPLCWRGAWLALASSALLGCNAKKEGDADAKSSVPKVVTVTVTPVERRLVERTVEVVGSLKGWEEVTVGAKRMGRVIKVYHDIGDKVSPGEPLVELETTDDDLNVVQAERSLVAQLEQIGLHTIPNGKFDESNVPAVIQARFALEKARQNFARERSLRQRGAGTGQDYQNAEIDEQAAEAALQNARLSAQTVLANAMVSKVMLEVRKSQRNDMIIRVPSPRRPRLDESIPIIYAVSKRAASEGQMLKEGEAVADLVVQNPLRLWTNVPEKFAADVQVGQDVRISVASHAKRTFVGKVSRINPSVDTTSRAFQVETSVVNDDGALRPGGFAKASIVVKRDDAALTVPLDSIIRFAGVTKLFIVSDDLKAKAIQVETGLDDRGWIEVIGSLPSQAKVVATGHSQLADGISVIIRDPKAPATKVVPSVVAKSDRSDG
jgi:multidrug efflux pump subunit AcrA (membrane-fusion protein)